MGSKNFIFRVNMMQLSQSCFFAKLNNQFKEYLEQGQGPIYLGLSGGVDSVVLLHVLVNAGFCHRIRALHLHHGLSENADDWFDYCQSLCHEYQVKFDGHKVTLDTRKHSIEEAARIARYDFFDSKLSDNAYLLLAHHAGDQAETLVFRLLRGTGGKGLAGMPEERALGRGFVYRPLLPFTKTSLIDYAKMHSLQWVEDESNQDEIYTRNYIRHRIIPKLQEFEPDAERRIEQAARRLAFDYRMLASLSQEKLSGWQAQDLSLKLDDIALLDQEQRVFWLRQYLAQFSISLTQAQMLAVDSSFLTVKDKQPCFYHKSARLMRYQNRLYVLPLERLTQDVSLKNSQTIERDFDSYSLAFAENSALEISDFSLKSKPETQILTLTNGHSRKLKKWFNDEQIPVWWREQLPYLFYQDKLVAIGDIWIDPNWQSLIQIKWLPKSELTWPKV